MKKTLTIYLPNLNQISYVIGEKDVEAFQFDPDGRNDYIQIDLKAGQLISYSGLPYKVTVETVEL